MDVFAQKPTPEGPDRITPEPEDFPTRVRRVIASFPRPHGMPPGFSIRRIAGWLAVLLLLAGAYAFVRGGFQTVKPGHLGVSVSHFTGTLETLPPGTHFRPRSLYDVHSVRVSDRLTSGPEGTFSVSTKEGVVAQMTVQAR